MQTFRDKMTRTGPRQAAPSRREAPPPPSPAHAEQTGGTIKPDVDDDQISRLAHALWEQAGRPEGLDQHFWFAARSELLPNEVGSSAATPAASPPE